jgi:hypothetical protein
MLFTNQHNIALPLAVFLATDDYDYQPNVISATALLRSTRQLVLTKRVNPEDNPIDIAGLVSSRMGSAIHAAIEKAWTNPKEALIKLGYPTDIATRVLVNPSQATLGLDKNIIPVYMEQRVSKQIEGYTVSGKYDFVAEGIVQDFKSTSVYGYLNQTNKEKYSLQGSIYKWLNPDIITKDYMIIHYIFTDWSSADAKRNNEYPQARVLSQRIPLLSIDDTEDFIVNRLTALKRFKDANETDIPYCDESELWRKESVWKYYKNPNKTERSTKTSSDKNEVFARFVEDGSVGIIKEIKGEVVACRYCSAFSVCTQKDSYLATGELNID